MTSCVELFLARCLTRNKISGCHSENISRGVEGVQERTWISSKTSTVACNRTCILKFNMNGTAVWRTSWTSFYNYSYAKLRVKQRKRYTQRPKTKELRNKNGSLHKRILKVNGKSCISKCPSSVKLVCPTKTKTKIPTDQVVFSFVAFVLVVSNEQPHVYRDMIIFKHSQTALLCLG